MLVIASTDPSATTATAQVMFKRIVLSPPKPKRAILAAPRVILLVIAPELRLPVLLPKQSRYEK